MGVRHAREYSEILQELTEAIAVIDDSFLFFEMEAADWNALDNAERRDVLEALADDVFYGLGEHHQIVVGSGFVTYVPLLHRIEVRTDEEYRVVHLI